MHHNLHIKSNVLLLLNKQSSNSGQDITTFSGPQIGRHRVTAHSAKNKFSREFHRLSQEAEALKQFEASARHYKKRTNHEQLQARM